MTPTPQSLPVTIVNSSVVETTFGMTQGPHDSRCNLNRWLTLFLYDLWWAKALRLHQSRVTHRFRLMTTNWGSSSTPKDGKPSPSSSSSSSSSETQTVSISKLALGLPLYSVAFGGSRSAVWFRPKSSSGSRRKVHFVIKFVYYEHFWR